MICYSKPQPRQTQQLAQDPRFIGGQIGMVGVLHTWGRNLAYHPHIHYLVPQVAWLPMERPGCQLAKTSSCSQSSLPNFPWQTASGFTKYELLCALSGKSMEAGVGGAL